MRASPLAVPAGLPFSRDLGLFGGELHSRIATMQRAACHLRGKFRRTASVVSGLIALVFGWAQTASGEIADWDAAVRPLDEGVPQVAVMRLRDILTRELTASDRQT